MAVIYTAEVTSSGDGRNGTVRSSDGIVDLALAAPKEVGGPGTATNPEQLFAAGYSACFHSAMRMAAREARVRLDGDTVTALVDLERDESGYRIGVQLRVALPGVEPDAARRLLDQAHARCPYSRAISGNVRVEIALAPGA
ncbi:organic hydroperoxide resistance protein [Streptomyces sp. CBMA123]|uniref:organic hydroperoxide resistance protein n=1 Tax=Streptomyces sp. CBMA123 TaxID=1896313 RepID=UPI001662104B|nr:organic hydroperoxide resistance protein [Streptomyces sp. CBMA123]MBD0694684.1 organic hydroperoxide resistance protein [Streptomyces sp. CBMA123]